MTQIIDKATNRRCFIKWLAGSQLFVGTSFSSFARPDRSQNCGLTLMCGHHVIINI